MGLKVYEVKKALGLSLEHAKYDDETRDAVIHFQKNHHLLDSGEVDLETWKALGLHEDDWYRLEVYVTPCLVDENSSRE